MADGKDEGGTVGADPAKAVRLYRRVPVSTWAEDRFQRLSKPKPNAQTLWVYLLTGPHTTAVPGLFCAGQAALAEALGWSLSSFRRCFTELSAARLAVADWDKRVVWLPDVARDNQPANANIVTGWRLTLEVIPDCSVKQEAIGAFVALFAERKCGASLLEALPEPFTKGSAKPLPEPFTKRSAKQEQEQEQEQKEKQEQEQQQEGPSLPNVPRAQKLAHEGAENEKPEQRWKFTSLYVSPKMHAIIAGATGKHAEAIEWDALYHAAALQYAEQGEPSSVLDDLKKRAKAAAATRRDLLTGPPSVEDTRKRLDADTAPDDAERAKIRDMIRSGELRRPLSARGALPATAEARRQAAEVDRLANMTPEERAESRRIAGGRV